MLFQNIDLELGPGSMMWIRGQNGRGKTSLLRLFAGLASPEAGEVQWGGAPLRHAPDYCAQLVFIGHANALKEDLTVSEAVGFLLRIHGRPNGHRTLSAALDRFGLGSHADRPVRTLSQGQRRRAALARLAVEETATTWILDEPFDALDVDGVDALNQILVANTARGGRVMLTSHQPLQPVLRDARQVDLDRYC